MIENRDTENCFFDTFDDMLMGDVTLFFDILPIAKARGF